ncbi:hypothetical protein F0562_003592 [Nyssa sinensis]|uniref:Uncharacterized protein n=1 Tax=Nyssa sinensis TaxID=561372 RepID=A0A5J5BZR5_9ASTE|nr:hypothetical protein F0562_003592 [Nyssa sinensis]
MVEKKWEMQLLLIGILDIGFQKLHAKFWNVLEILVPHIKHIGDTKLLHCQVCYVVHHICKKVVLLDYPEAYSRLGESFILATKNGIHEVVEEILKKFPSVIGFKDEDNYTAFQLAIMYRHEIIFNIINQYGGQEEFLSDLVDNKGNNILHLAGYLARENRLNLMSPAILQVQRELQWYKGALFVCGGVIFDVGCPLNLVLKYEMTKNCWTVMKKMITARSFFASGVIEGMIYVAGGNNTDLFELNSAEVLDPDKGIWQPIANMGTRMASYDAAVLNRKLLVTEGWFWPFYFVPRGQIYDPKTDNWEGMAAGLREGWTGSSVVVYGPRKLQDI